MKLLSIALLGLLAACSGASSEPEPAPSILASLDRQISSNAESFVLHWQAVAEAPPLNEEYDMLFALRDSAGQAVDLDVADIRLDARMPHHGHGMTQDPVLERSGPGEYRARGMRLHMTGHWEVYVDVRQGPVWERAEFVLNLQ